MLGEFSRNSVGIPPEVNTDFDDEKQNRRNDELFFRKSTLILITKNRRNVEANLPKLYRHSSGIQTNFDNEK